MAWQRLVDDFAGTEGVDVTVLLSRDGLPLAASTGISPDDVDQLAAIASSLHGLARNAADRFGGLGAGVRRTVVEMHTAAGASRFLLVAVAGNGGLLAVLTSLNADLGEVAGEMAGLARQICGGVAIRQRAHAALNSVRPGDAGDTAKVDKATQPTQVAGETPNGASGGDATGNAAGNGMPVPLGGA
jgi:predicted regulator of Ras-like GTPase activity (Roadblock/LC7/MglB family)